MNPVIADAVTVTEYYLAVTLVYAGCPLVSVAQKEKGVVAFVVICPECDFNIYRDKYYAGKLQVSDVRAFGETVTRIGKLMRVIRQDGEPWFNPDYLGDTGTDWRE